MSTVRSNPDVRTRLIEAAIRLLATNGPSEVKARSVANEAGLSTMGVYSHFGGVPELLQAVADEGLGRLAAAFGLVQSTDDPLADLCAMSLAYRDVARRNPHLYDLMFGLSIHGRYSLSWGTATQVSSEHSPAFNAVYSLLVKACARLVDANCVQKISASLIAMQLWSAVHGFVMLELADHFTDLTDPLSEVLVPMCTNLIVGLGAKRERVEASTAGVVNRWASPPQVQPGKPRSQKTKRGKAKSDPASHSI
ncbi:TetR/AcrR family transcriptional regulator [Paraburkholderia sp. MM5384-R2]|uniref:TetR/AcrR family transcriptional regulator n=1 Tax=Paraburkholderia sp. MM5384-R2 TaxID=2723097 RepID=UPI0018163D03|nr:TetR/AcrR family transcriptional regulator [Paraburkholderia sp. MM5384-R2]MBB5498789.1 AcrR family transcriptional regulator [Paraburkholderia sp. MM5384-R2]